MRRTTFFLVLGFVLLWNSGFIAAEYGLPYARPFSLLFWRYLALTLIVLAYLLIRNRLLWVGWRMAAPNMLVGALAHGVWLLCVLLALDYGVPAGIVALVVALQPLATGALSGLATGERPHFYQWLGLGIGFLGVVLTLSSRIDFGDYRSVFGYLIPLGSVLGITAASLIQRKMELKRSGPKLPVDLTLFYHGCATVLVIGIPALFVDEAPTAWVPEFVFALGWMVLGVSLGAYGLMWVLIERMDATRVASLFYLGPPVTMLMGWMAFGDLIQLMDIVGVIVVFAGVLLTQLAPDRK